MVVFGWCFKLVKDEICDNFMWMFVKDEEFYLGVIGYENMVILEINIVLLFGYDLLFFGEKG